MSVFVICVEAIIYLLLYNSHDCTFKLLHFLLLLDNKIYADKNRAKDIYSISLQ